MVVDNSPSSPTRIVAFSHVADENGGDLQWIHECEVMEAFLGRMAGQTNVRPGRGVTMLSQSGQASRSTVPRLLFLPTLLSFWVEGLHTCPRAPNGLELPAPFPVWGAARPSHVHPKSPSWPGPLQRVVRRTLFRRSEVAQNGRHQDGVSSADVEPSATLVSCAEPRSAPSHTPTSTKPLPIMKEISMLSLKSHAAMTTVEIGNNRNE